MANTIGRESSTSSLYAPIFNEELWAANMQEIFFKENRAIALANTELRTLLNDGDTLHKPYRSHLIAQDYTKGTDITVQDISGADEFLRVETAKVVPFYVDAIDKLQNKWDIAAKFAQDAQKVLNNILDQAVLAEYSNATTDIYNDDIGGSGSTTPIPLTTSNIFNVFSAAGRNLDYLNIPSESRFAVLSPRALETLRLSIAGRETGVGDIVGANGKVGNRFGFELYESNNCPFGATFTPSDGINPGDTETVTIAGVIFTFKTTLGTTAGEVHICSDTEHTLANLATLINAPRTSVASATDAGVVALSDADAWKLTHAGIAATSTATTLSITGYGDITVAASVDPWSVQIQHLLFGLKGATDLVVQKSPNVEFRVAEKRLGRYVYPWIKNRVVQVKFSLIVSEAQKWVTRAKDKLLSTLNDLAREPLIGMQKSELCL